MQEIKKCAHCNSDNPIRQIYCIHCGKFLAREKVENLSRKTIWDFDNKGFPIINNNTIENPNNENVVICPQCMQVHHVSDGVLPLSCEHCGYFFQMGIDRIISRSQLNKKENTNNKLTNLVVTDEANKNRNDKKTQGKHSNINETSMRLIIRTYPGHIPESVNPLGDIIGINGTILKQLKTSQQIKIHRAPTGWYIDVLQGETLVNSVLINKQIQRKLENGDMITIENEQVFVEIV